MITPGRVVSYINIVLFPLYWIAAQFILPEFAQFFARFDEELPWLTQVVMESAGYWWVLIFVPLLERFLSGWGRQVPRLVRGVVTAINYLLGLLAIIFVPLVILALYLPIFEMGRVVAQ